MAMEIGSTYNSYAGSYAATADSRKKAAESKDNAEESNAIKRTAETGSTIRKTAADELAYLSKKYSNYSFLAASYSKGMRYGSNSTVNVAIDPRFLEKMANNPELEKEYEKQIAGMQECDEQKVRSQAARGWRVVAQGWAIDKDGGISKWSIVQKDDKKSHLQTMSETAEKIRRQNEEKKQEKAELEEKRQASREEKEKLQEKMDETGKEKFGTQWKGAVVIDEEEGTAAVIKEANKHKGGAVGVNLDRKA